MLIDVQRNGRPIKGLVHPGRNGYLWGLERGPDKISFVDAKAYGRQNAFTSGDSATGRPSYDAEHKPVRCRLVGFCPAPCGGTDCAPASRIPRRKPDYIPSNVD